MAKRVNHIVTKGDNPAWPKGSKSRGFSTRKGTMVEQLIQVCYDMTSEKTRKRELDALVEVAGELHCDNLLVVTNDQQEKINWKGKKVSIIPIYKYK